MAARTVAMYQACPTMAAWLARARTGVAATPPAPIEALTTRPPSSTTCSARQTAEMSSSKRLEIL